MKTVLRYLLRVRFTLGTIFIMAAAAVVSRTIFGPISLHYLHTIGYAPDDLPGAQFWRIFTGVWFTMGGTAFWGTVLMVALIVGFCEYRLGTIRTALTFWGGHLAATLLLSVIVLLFQEFLNSLAILTTASTRDVGASAGYFTCLGLVCATLPVRFRRLVIPTTAVFLVGALLFTIVTHGAPASEHSSGLVHLLSYPLGIMSSKLFRPVAIQGCTRVEGKTD